MLATAIEREFTRMDVLLRHAAEVAGLPVVPTSGDIKDHEPPIANDVVCGETQL